MSLGSSRGKGTAVKTMSRFGRIFDGWQAGLVVVVTAILVSLIVVPRPVLPDEIPLPLPDQVNLTSVSAQEAARALAAERDGLPFEVRSVGEAIRQFGWATSQGDKATASRLQMSLLATIRTAHRYDPELLLRLRAYQTKQFDRELKRFESTGVESDALRELGGDFLQIARQAQWLRTTQRKAKLVADDRIRSILFRKRWNDIAKLTKPPFSLSLDEERALHSFLFQNPVVQVPYSHRRNIGMRCSSANEYLLRKVATFGNIDPSYPTDYVRGILLLRLGRTRAALGPLVRFLENHPDGPHTLRARNALRYAQDQMHGEFNR